MKQTATNNFQDGLNKDLHPIVTPNSVLTDNLNGTFITYNGNEFCLQNDRGNTIRATLSAGFTPIGIKEHNGVLYIVSCNDTGESEIGTYPGIDWSGEKEEPRPFLDKYTPLHNYVLDAKSDPFDNNELKLTYSDLRTDKFNFDKGNPVSIEIQDSYDGSINLILTDGKNNPLLINTGFSVMGEQYKLIESNTYLTKDGFEAQTALIKKPVSFARIELEDVYTGGQLPGGNYTFYVRLGDADGNMTNIIAESGIVSIFKGTVGQPSTISGTLADERTDKMVSLNVSPLNSGYPKVYLYYVREYSDTQGFLMNEAKQLVEPFDVNMTSAGNFCNITVTGYEDTTSVSIEDLNIQYYSNDTVKTITQQQDMLFAGGITVDTYSPDDFTKYAQLIKTSLSRYNPDENSEVDNITGVTNDYKGDAEYYNVHNIYSKVGYWPGEYYRFGIVFILNNGSNSNVFNMIGGDIDFDTVITKGTENSNDSGIFRTCMQDSSNAIISDSAIVPWHFKFDTSVMKNEIKKDNAPIKGFFIVRQKRIPEAIIQGLQIGIEQNTHLPCTNLINAADIWSTLIKHSDNSKLDQEIIKENGYVMESFCGRDNWWISNDDYCNTKEFENKLTYMPVTAYGTSIVRTHKYQVAIPVKLSCWGPPNVSLAVVLSVLDGVIPWLLPFAIPAKIIWANDIYAKECSTTYYAIMEYDKNGENGEIKEIRSNPGTLELREVQQYWFNTNNKSFVESSNYGDENPWVTWKPDKKAWPGTYISDQRWYEIRNEVRGNKDKYIGKLVAETFKTDPIKKSSIEQSKEFISRLFPVTPDGYCSGILSVEAMVTPQLKTKLNGSEVVVEKIGKVSIEPNDDNTVSERLMPRRTAIHKYEYENQISPADDNRFRAVYVERNVKTKVVDNCAFSTIAGNPYKESDFGKAFSESVDDKDWNYENLLHKVVRGKYTPYIGLCNYGYPKQGSNIIQLSLRTKDPNNAYAVRKQDKSPFYTVSDRYAISDSTSNDVHIYRGDCYVTTQTIRLNSNFIDPSYPFTDKIVKPDSWKEAVEKYIDKNDSSFDEANITDLNTVSLGYWITFKCLASTNLAFRSEDVFDTQTTAMMGNPRSFFPLSGSTATSDKQDESELMNAGYGITVGEIRYQEQPDVPYIKQEYGTRVIFSNKNVTDAFVNGYRVFQGASYQDYDKQYGNIVKLLPWGNNLFCVFEHGLALLPINEKALMQTTTDQTIHIYGHGVLPEQMTIISHDYGSKYPDSVIRTPIGIYGVDTDAKKIWRFSDKQGFETLSDMKIESFLNDNLFTDKAVKIETCDVRTHYNAFKGDVMFTFYNNDEDNYFKIDTSDVVLNIDESKTIKCYTNLPDKDVTITTIGNVKVNYVNGELTITGIAIGSSKVLINDNTINVKVKDSQETFNYLELSRSSIILSTGQSITLVPNTNVSNPEYTWMSSNTNVATVDQYGTITAVKTGSCIISVTINNTTYSANCRVKVLEDNNTEGLEFEEL